MILCLDIQSNGALRLGELPHLIDLYSTYIDKPLVSVYGINAYVIKTLLYSGKRNGFSSCYSKRRHDYTKTILDVYKQGETINTQVTRCIRVVFGCIYGYSNAKKYIFPTSIL